MATKEITSKLATVEDNVNALVNSLFKLDAETNGQLLVELSDWADDIDNRLKKVREQIEGNVF